MTATRPERHIALRKWYFAVNEKGFADSDALLQVAIGSCLQNTGLHPICLYNGSDEAHIARLRSLGATVLPHRSSIEPILRAGYGAQYDTFSGHWLRIDIPLLEQEDDTVLYTDIDVMFTAPPPRLRRPKYLSAAPERYRWRWPHFNSGVMVLHLPALRAVHERFVAQITRRMAKGWHPPGHDQISYNRMFRWHHARLPLSMNWKPYWGVNGDARIVHFHGPKPVHVRAIHAGHTDAMLPVYSRLHARNPAAYAYYGAMADRLLT